MSIVRFCQFNAKSLILSLLTNGAYTEPIYIYTLSSREGPQERTIHKRASSWGSKKLYGR